MDINVLNIHLLLVMYNGSAVTLFWTIFVDEIEQNHAVLVYWSFVLNQYITFANSPYTLKNAGLFFQPKCWVETAGLGRWVVLTPILGWKLVLIINPAALGCERGPEGEHAHHVNIRGHPRRTPVREAAIFSAWKKREASERRYGK